MPPDCACGQPATQRVDTGRVRVGGRSVQCFEDMCPRCARLFEWEREEGRNG